MVNQLAGPINLIYVGNDESHSACVLTVQFQCSILGPLEEFNLGHAKLKPPWPGPYENVSSVNFYGFSFDLGSGF